MAQTFLYDAFISYRHGGRDQEVAQLLHRWLETYRTPAEIVRKGALPRLARVFRDQEELQTSSDLSESIKTALAQSRFLIVICSPRATESAWIDQEIEHFRKLGRGGSILALLIHGEPETAFPKSLYTKERVAQSAADGTETWIERTIEPLAANISAPDLKDAKKLLKIEQLKLLSPILGCSFDDLRGRHQERARRRLAVIAASMAALTLILAGIATYAVLQRNQAIEAQLQAQANAELAQKNETRARQNEELAQTNEKRARQNEELAQQNEKRAQENAELAQANEKRARQNEERAVAEADRAEKALVQRAVQESNRVAALASEMADRGRINLPMALALQVTPHDGARDKRPLTASINALLTRLVRTDRSAGSIRTGENALAITATRDEKWIFAGTSEGSVQIWQMPGLRLARTIKVQSDSITSLEISPDEKSLLVAGGQPSVWDIASGTKRFDINLPRGGFSKTSQYALGGQVIVASSNSNHIYVFQASDGQLVKAIRGPDYSSAFDLALSRAQRFGDTSGTDPIMNSVANAWYNNFGATTDIVISPDGKRVAVAGPGDPASAVRLYSLPDGELLQTLSGSQYRTIGSVPSFSQRILFSPDGQRLFTISEGRIRSQIQGFDLTSGVLKSTFIVPTVAASTLASDSKGNILLSGHADGSIVLWCIADGRFVSAFSTHANEVTALVTSSDGRYFLSTSDDGSAALWAMPDANEVCAAKSDNLADLRLATIKPIATLDGHTAHVNNGVILLAAREIVTASRDGSLRSWRLDERGVSLVGETPKSEVYPTDAGEVNSDRVVFFDNDRKLLVSPKSGESSTWEIASGKKLASFETGRIALDPKGGTLRIFNSATQAERIDPTSGMLMAEKSSLTSYNPGFGLRWVVNADGSRATTGSTTEGEQIPSLYDTGARKRLTPLQVHSNIVYAPQFSDDGAKLLGLAKSKDDELSTHAGGWIAVWDSVTGRELAQSTYLKDAEERLLASRDGHIIVARAPTISLTFQLFRPLPFVLEGDKLKPLTLALPSELSQSEGAAIAAALSADGRILAAATAQGSLYAWALPEGRLMGSFQAGSSAINQIALSSDGSFMAASDFSGQVFMFNLTGEDGASLPMGTIGIGRQVTDLAFSPTGKNLAALTADHMAHVIRVDPLGLEHPDRYAIVDWARAQHVASTNPEDETKYGLAAPELTERSDLAALAGGIPTAKSQEIEATQCDKLAADPYDADRRAPAVEAEAMAPQVAQAACEMALRDHPEDATTIYQAGRTLLRIDKTADAIKLLRRAADKKYPAALSRLALLLNLNPDLPREGLDLDRLMREAAEAGDLLGTLWVNAAKLRENDPTALTQTIRSAMRTERADAAAAALRAGKGTEKFLNREPDVAALALAPYQLAVILSQSLKSGDKDRLWITTAATDRIRAIAGSISPDRMIAAYRMARDWRMP